MRPFFLSLLILLAPSGLVAQTFEEKVTVSYIEVPVTVIGRDNVPVRGLTKADFELLEEGQRREIHSFDAIDFAAAGTRSVASASPLNPAARRNVLLLLDLSFANPGSITRAQTAARNYIARSLGDRDRVGIATIDAERGVRLLTAFTTDRNALTAAVADPRNFRSFDPLLIGGRPIDPSAVSGVAADASSTGQRGVGALETAADFARMEKVRDDSMQRARVRRQIETLSIVARALQRLAGRKHVVLMSEGFNPRTIQGRGAAESREQTEENEALQYGEVWKVDSDARFGNTGMQTTLSLMAEEFRRSDVVLHAIDVQGVRSSNDVRGGATVNSNEGLFLLANATGGTVFQNSNDIGSELERFSRQHEVVYVLGFHSPARTPGEFRNIRVRVTTPGVRVQHRSGYYAHGSGSDIERSLSAAEVILNDIPQDEIGLHSLVAAFPGNDSAAIVPVILEISGADLVRHAENGITTTDIFVYAFDPEGLVRGSVHQRVRMEIAKVGDQLRASGVRFYGTLRLPPGRYAVRTLVSAAGGERKGFRRDELVVPAIDDIAMVQPLFFAEAGDWIMVKAASDGDGTPYPFIHDGEAFIPAVRPSLRRGEPRLFSVFVYNSDPEELEWEITPDAKPVSVAREEYVTRYLFAIESFPADLDRVEVTVRRKDSTDARSAGTAVTVR